MTLLKPLKSNIDYIIAFGYYLKDSDDVENHTQLTYEIFIKGLETKKQILDKDFLELVFFDNNKNCFVANWYDYETDKHEYIDFKMS